MSKDITDELIIREETSGYSFEKSGVTMEQDINKLIEELTNVRPDELSTEGLKLFNKINEIIDINKELEEKLNETLNANLALVQGNVNSIPVSLVEEKIEEYQNNMKLYENETHNIFNENNIRQEVITVLQELLEKRK